MAPINSIFPMSLTYTQLGLVYGLPLTIQKLSCKHFTHNSVNSLVLDYSHFFIIYTHFFTNGLHNKNETSSILGAYYVAFELHARI